MRSNADLTINVLSVEDLPLSVCHKLRMGCECVSSAESMPCQEDFRLTTADYIAIQYAGIVPHQKQCLKLQVSD